MEYETFLKVLEGIQAADNEIRNGAVRMFEQLKAQNPTNAMQLILQCLTIEQKEKLRLQSALLLKNLFPLEEQEKNAVWSKLDIQLQIHVKDTLLNLLLKEPDKVTRRNLCVTIGNLAYKLAPKQQWPELYPKLNEMLSTSNGVYQQSALKILGELAAVFSIELLSGKPSNVTKIVSSCIASQDIDVRLECVGFIVHLVETGEKKLFKDITHVVPQMMETLIGMCQMDHANLIDFLLYLVRIAEANSLFFKPHGQLLCHRICSIGMDESMSDEARSTAVEVLLSLAANKPKLALKIKDFVKSVTKVLMVFMLDIKDEKYATWLETGKDLDEQRLYHVGEEGLDRLAQAFENEEDAKTIETIFAALGPFLSRNEWYYKFVGVMTISQTAEYIPVESLGSHLDDIMQVLFMKLQDGDARVRFAACQAIGQVALDHPPFVQENYHKEGLSSLIRAMSDSSPRVQSHAMCAFINFTEEVAKAALQPYVDFLMQQLLSQISLQTPCIVREQAITAIAVIAGVIEKDFMQYYAVVMPSIMNIVEKCISKEERTCRGKAIECISIVGIAVGQELFVQDSGPAMNALLQIASGGFADDDPVKEYVQHAMSRMCRLMEEHFVPYLPQIVPSLLVVLAGQPQEITSEEAENANEDMTMVLLSEKAFALKTSLLEDMKHALDLIGTFAEVLAEKFVDHIPACTAALLPLLSFFLSDEIKQKALSTMANLIDAARKVTEATGDKAMLHAMVTSTVESVFKNLDEANESDYIDDEAQVMVAEATGLNDCILQAGPSVLPEATVKSYTSKVFKLLWQSTERRLQYEAEHDESDSDEDDIEKLNREEQDEQTVRSSLLEILGALMQTHKQEFMNSSLGFCTEFIENNIKPNCSSDDRALALYVCVDMFEHLGELSIPLWSTLLPPVMNSIMDDEPRIRQAACYAISQACKVSAFCTFANDAAKLLWASACKPFKEDAVDDTAAADNAIATLGDCVRLHYGFIETADRYLKYWLEYLPLKQDVVEGLRVHTELMDHVLKRHPLILGPENSHLNRIVGVFVDIYGTNFSDDPLNDSIRGLLQQLGDAYMNSLLPTLSKAQQKQLERIARDVQVKQNNV